MNYCFTMNLKTVNSITEIADLLNILTVKNMIILLKSVIKFRNIESALSQNMMTANICSKVTSLCINVLIAILSTQLDSSSAEFEKNNWKKTHLIYIIKFHKFIITINNNYLINIYFFILFLFIFIQISQVLQCSMQEKNTVISSEFWQTVKRYKLNSKLILKKIFNKYYKFISKSH